MPTTSTLRARAYRLEVHFEDGESLGGPTRHASAGVLQGVIKQLEAQGRVIAWAAIHRVDGGDSVVAYYRRPVAK